MRVFTRAYMAKCYQVGYTGAPCRCWRRSLATCGPSPRKAFSQAVELQGFFEIVPVIIITGSFTHYSSLSNVTC